MPVNELSIGNSPHLVTSRTVGTGWLLLRARLAGLKAPASLFVVRWSCGNPATPSYLPCRRTSGLWRGCRPPMHTIKVTTVRELLRAQVRTRHCTDPSTGISHCSSTRLKVYRDPVVNQSLLDDSARNYLLAVYGSEANLL